MQQNLDRFQFKCWDRDNGILLPDGTFPLTGWIFDIYYIITIKTILSDPEKYSKRFTILQSTGLKDKNGKLIFEYDIIEMYSPNIKGLIFFDDFYSCMKIQAIADDGSCQGEATLLTKNFANGSAIIGNRFEQPQLLKKL